MFSGKCRPRAARVVNPIQSPLRRTVTRRSCILLTKWLCSFQYFFNFFPTAYFANINRTRFNFRFFFFWTFLFNFTFNYLCVLICAIILEITFFLLINTLRTILFLFIIIIIILFTQQTLAVYHALLCYLCIVDGNLLIVIIRAQHGTFLDIFIREL